MFKNVYYNKYDKIVHLWDDVKGHLKIPYEPYAYKLDVNGNFKTIYDEPCTKVYEWDKDDEAHGIIYESDINPEIRTLVDIYHKSEEQSKNHKILFFDIEVSMIGGASDAMDADNEITAIAYKLNNSKTVCLLLDKENKIQPFENDRVIVKTYSLEIELLKEFIKQFDGVDIITGWNIKKFDVPYIYNRIIKVLNKTWAKKLSPISIVNYNRYNDEWTIAGISILDYMVIYKQYIPNELSSYALDFVCKLELGRGKIPYNGTLDDLYRDDKNLFIDYVSEDVQLVYDLDLKIGFIGLVLDICHTSHIPYQQHSITSLVEEGSILTFTKNNNIVVPNKKEKLDLTLKDTTKKGTLVLEMDNTIQAQVPRTGTLVFKVSDSKRIHVEYVNYHNNTFQLRKPLHEDVLFTYPITIGLPGAFVKVPVVGLHEYIYDLDAKALYPSCIRTLNLSPETKVGRVLDFNDECIYKKKDRKYDIYFDNGDFLTFNKFNDLWNFIKSNKFTIAANGVLYRTDKKGILPIILEKWDKERAEFKSLRKKYQRENNKDLASFYDRRQWSKKIISNSLYGVLALASFRFSDIDNAEAITTTGKSVLQFSDKCANQYYNNSLNTQKVDYVIYSDTDSVFLSTIPIIKSIYPEIDINNDKTMIQKTIEISVEVSEYINKLLSVYSPNIRNSTNNQFIFKQENVAKSGFWVAKKRYAQWMVNMEGVNVEKLDVKGLDTVRSSFPVSAKDLMTEILWDILKKVDKSIINEKILLYKTELKDKELLNRMFSVGVKNIQKYDYEGREQFQYPKGITAHAKAFLTYNDLLKYYNLNYEHINNGGKVKWCYLKDTNPLKLETIALRGYNDPPKIVNYVMKHIDNNQMFISTLSKKLKDFYDAMKWGKLPEKENKVANQFFKF